MLKIHTILLVLALGLCLNAERFEFNNYKLVQLKPKSVRHLDAINKWSENSDVILKQLYIYIQVLTRHFVLIVRLVDRVEEKHGACDCSTLA